MLKVEKFETYGWEAAIRGMRNPLNSWAKSDSGWRAIKVDELVSEHNNWLETDPENLMIKDIGPNDLDLMKRLRKGGSDDRKYMRQIFISCDITAPLYWWKEMDQYKVSTVTNSCSTMHKIASKEFVLEDFSHEHLMTPWDTRDIKVPMISVPPLDDTYMYSPTGMFNITIDMLNECRKMYLETKDKRYWWQMIQLLPSSYNQKRTWTANYEVLANIYQARHAHKLDEWHTFCEAIEGLPYANELIIGVKQ